MKKYAIILVFVVFLLPACSVQENDLLESSSYQDMKLKKVDTSYDSTSKRNNYYLIFEKGNKEYKFEVESNIHKEVKDQGIGTMFDFVADDDDIFGIALSKTRK